MTHSFLGLTTILSMSLYIPNKLVHKAVIFCFLVLYFDDRCGTGSGFMMKSRIHLENA